MQSPYSPEFIEAQKVRLETEKRELTARLESLAEYNEVEGVWSVKGPDYNSGEPEDIADDATEANDVIDNEAQVEDLSRELDNVNAALACIANGTYGFDTEAGSYIPKERLEAYPAATQLVEDGK